MLTMLVYLRDRSAEHVSVSQGQISSTCQCIAGTDLLNMLVYLRDRSAQHVSVPQG